MALRSPQRGHSGRGLYIAQLSGQAPRAVVGLLGGGMVILFSARLGQALADGSFERNRASIVDWLVAAAPGFTWAGVGDGAQYGMLVTLILFVIGGLLRYGIQSVRERPFSGDFHMHGVAADSRR